jgi:secreted protein with Ig-like and vWFA domain
LHSNHNFRYVVVDSCFSDNNRSIEAKLKNEEGKTETHGLTILDVVKHAVKTVVKLLNDDDRLSIVYYSSTAGTAHALSSMTLANQTKAIDALEKLQPNGSTNLWAGLKLGLDQLAAAARPGRASTVLVLTDGQPNCEPARGHIGALEGYQRKCERAASIWTFGFGYDIDSTLLVALARKGGGCYAFIPDSSMVGSAFVNATATMLTGAGQHATLRVELDGAVVDGESLCESCLCVCDMFVIDSFFVCVYGSIV